MNAAVALIALKTIETRAALVGQVHSMYLVESTFWKLVPETVEGWVAKVSTYRDPAHLYVGLRERFVYYCASLQSTLLSISSFEKCLIWPKCSLQLLPWNVFLAALESSLLQAGAQAKWLVQARPGFLFFSSQFHCFPLIFVHFDEYMWDF